MELVMDANILVSAFLRAATTRELLLDERLTLWSPEYSLTETEEVLSSFRIRKRFGNLTKNEIQWVLSQITSKVRFVPAAAYQYKMSLAKKLAPHDEDAPYLALSLYLDIDLWSNDSGFKNQSSVQIYTTKELLKCLK